jgi:hypothetical protein
MISNIVLEILELALSIAKTQASGKIQKDATLAGLFVQIIKKAVQAYQDHTGEALDLSLIRPEQPL